MAGLTLYEECLKMKVGEKKEFDLVQAPPAGVLESMVIELEFDKWVTIALRKLGQRVFVHRKA